MPPASLIALRRAKASRLARASSRRFWASFFFSKSSALPETLAFHHASAALISSGATLASCSLTNARACSVARGLARTEPGPPTMRNAARTNASGRRKRTQHIDGTPLAPSRLAPCERPSPRGAKGDSTLSVAELCVTIWAERLSLKWPGGQPYVIIPPRGRPRGRAERPGHFDPPGTPHPGHPAAARPGRGPGADPRPGGAAGGVPLPGDRLHRGQPHGRAGPPRPGGMGRRRPGDDRGGAAGRPARLAYPRRNRCAPLGRVPPRAGPAVPGHDLHFRGRGPHPGRAAGGGAAPG